MLFINCEGFFDEELILKTKIVVFIKKISDWIITGVKVTSWDVCRKGVEFVSLKILFVACLSLIIESGISCARGGDNARSTRMTEERVSALFVLLKNCSIGISEEDGWCLSIKSIDACWSSPRTDDDGRYCSL